MELNFVIISSDIIFLNSNLKREKWNRIFHEALLGTYTAVPDLGKLKGTMTLGPFVCFNRIVFPTLVPTF